MSFEDDIDHIFDNERFLMFQFLEWFLEVDIDNYI